MDKTRKLERRWYKYRAKKLSSSMFIFSLFPLVIVGGYFIGLNFDKLEALLFHPSSTTVQSVQPIQNISKTVEKNLTVTSPIEPLLPPPVVVKKEIIEEEELALEPVIPIIDMEQERVKRTYRKPSVSRPKKNISHGVRAKPNTYLTAQDLSKVKYQLRDTTQLKKIHLHSSSKNYIKTMKEKFLKSKQPREALLLAQEFYRRGEYVKSESWAFKANKIDSNLDESWIIFAKSKAKMSKKNEAIKILSAYYNKSKSAKVRVAIEKIKTGKL